MFNEIDYDLVELDLPNIVYAHGKGNATPMVSHPFLRPLLIKLAKARPKWKLVGTRFAMRESGPHWAVSFKVMDGNDDLGTFRKDYNYSASCDCFAIDNARMAAVRQRGNVTTTKDVAKAFKIITSKFHSKTPEERIKDARERAYGHVSTNIRSRSSRFSGIIGNLRSGMQEFVEANWEAFTAFAADHGGIGMANLDQYHEAKEDARVADVLEKTWGADAGHIVILRGSDYIIKDKNGHRVVSTEELAPYLKRSIGMLKLTEVGTYVPSCGVKTADDEMFLLPEQKEA